MKNKCICIDPISKFIKNGTYKISVVQQGTIFMPYLMANTPNIIESNFEPKKLINSRYLIAQIDNDNYNELKIEKETDKHTPLTDVGYNVYFDEKNYNYYKLEIFEKHFKTLKQLRKEKLNQINNI